MRFARSIFATLFLLAVMAGCATRPRIDWNARVGNYTYDQAIIELGVPDKFAKLNDNTSVAEWVVRRYGPDYFTFGLGAGYWGGPYWAGPEFGFGYPVGPFYTRWLRLVFASDGKLREWKRYER